MKKYWRDLFGRRQLERDLKDEIEAHVALEIRKRIDAGQSPENARLGALQEVQSVALVAESTRDEWTWASMDRLMQDVRYSIRVLRRSPMFAIVVILSLAIGMGANASFFSLADAMLFRTLPLPGAGELVFFDWTSGLNRLALDLTGTYSKDPETGMQIRTSFSFLTFKAFREQSQTLSDVFGFYPLYSVTVNVDGQADLIPGQLVSGNYFSGLRTPMAIGRAMTDEDDQPVAVISHRYWQRRFNEDPGVLGKNIVMNGVPLTIVGVTAAGFDGTQGFGNPTDISAPLGIEPQLMDPVNMTRTPWTWWVRVMGRIKPGITYRQVQAEFEEKLHRTGLEGFNAAPASIRSKSSTSPDMPRLRVQSGSRGLTDSLNNMGPNGWRASQYLIPMAGIAGMLLLIVCLNVANLLLARSFARQKEIGVRLALGAGRGRIVRQMLTETILLSLASGVLGSIAAYWGKNLLAALIPLAGITSGDLRIDPHVLALTGFLSVLSGGLLGLAPALRLTRDSLAPALKNSGRSLVGPRTRLGKVLLVAQVAMSLVLLIGAGLFVRTLGNLKKVDVGFNATNLLLFRITPGALKYDNARIGRLYRDLLDRAASLPGVLQATYSDYPLVINSGNDMRLTLKGPTLPHDTFTVARLRVHSAFFEALRIPIVSGRSLSADDGETAPRVAVVNEAFVRKFLPGRDPVGEHVGAMLPVNRLPSVSVDIEIVGVVKDVSIRIAREEVPPTVYLPDAQLMPEYATFAVRTAGDPLLLVPTLREAVLQIDPNLPLRAINTQQEQIEQGFATERIFAIASAFFGGIAVVLACIGLFGLMSYSVERRTAEIGLRMALGARRLDVVRLVMGRTLALVLLGVLIGTAAASMVARTITTMLFHVTASDPGTVMVATATMIGIAGVAAYLPARRAASVDPTIALRSE